MSDRRLSVELRQPGPIPLDVAFSCDPGDVLAIFGPSGSGKTTILRSIAGLYQPATASIRSGDEVWTDTTRRISRPPHRRTVGFVFQEYALFPHLTALGNVMTALTHRPAPERRARAESVLAQVRLSGSSSRRPHELSGGERQRVALARALAREPAVLLLDEPFAAVDRAVRRQLQDEIDGLRRTLDVPMILVTHDFDDVARLATHVLLLERGRVIASDAIERMTARPDLGWLRDAAGLGSVVDGVVTETYADRGLIEIACRGCTLLAPGLSVPAGRRVRVRIPAKEVILATGTAAGLSLHNVLNGEVTSVHSEPGLNLAVVQIAVGETRLLAEVTRDAVARLGVGPGVRLNALIKSVSLQVMPADNQPGEGTV